MLSFEDAAAYVRQVGHLHAFNDNNDEVSSTVDDDLLEWLLTGPNRFFTRTVHLSTPLPPFNALSTF